MPFFPARRSLQHFRSLESAKNHIRYGESIFCPFPSPESPDHGTCGEPLIDSFRCQITIPEEIIVIHGLSSAEVEERRRQGLANKEISPPTKTVGQIFKSNIFTYFNAIFIALAIFAITAGAWEKLTFMGIVISNTAIGIVQELRSKKVLDKMALLTERKCAVVRDGAEQTVGVHDTVQGDAVIFRAGSQIFADATIVDGDVVANEALITGEADEIPKKPGDSLISGSFIMSGQCVAELTAVGENSFASKLTIEAKKSKNRGKSEMMAALTRFAMVMGILFIPLGVAMIVKEFFILDQSYRDGVVHTVGALGGMIPQGLYLLTSLALMTAIVRLVKKRTLVHEMSCIETLARVDTLCVDKTGTITENKMTVEDVVPIASLSVSNIAGMMSDYVFAHQADNDTMLALKRYFTGATTRKAVTTLPFTSSRKYGAVTFAEGDSYLLGAPDVILGDRFHALASTVNEYSAKGCRVLLLAAYAGDISAYPLDGAATPLALILLANKIRDEAPETFRFFAENNVAIKVISGDNAMAVSEVARRAGIAGADRYIDARELDTDEKIVAAANEYTVFGRVTPEQKKKLIRAMRKAGHTVAMTGDGVNDVLALKEADCSVAMASGSDIAAQASHIVLLDSDFSAMPSIVAEGRRVINNIERSAALYVWKNIFSLVLAVITLIFTVPYPIDATHLTIIAVLTTGFPSFILALEPNKNLVRGHFMRNVLVRTIPAALTALIVVIGMMLINTAVALPFEQLSAVCFVLLGIVGLLMLYSTSMPFNALRAVLSAGMTVGFIVVSVIGMAMSVAVFSLVPLEAKAGAILAVLAVLTVPSYVGIHIMTQRVGERISAFLAKRRAVKEAKEASVG